MPPVATNGNAVDFILDGRNFFTELKTLLDLVRVADAGAGTYVRMASWSADVGCNIGANAGSRLTDEINAVADAGHQVDILLWGPTWVDQKGSPLARDVHRQNTAFYELLNGTREGRIRVYLETYGGWVGSATHQKMVIGSIAGQRTAIMGGINLENHYRSNPTHNPIGGNSWHDSAVKVRGPATADIEAEWVRRWNKSKLALTANTTAQTQHAPVGGAQVSVTIATTNTETYTRVNDIRDLLIAAIGNANNYVYLENYAMCDPGIVTALRNRMIAVPGLQAIVVGNYDLTGDDYPYKYLMRNTWLKLASTNFRSITVAGKPSNRTVLRSSRPDCTISEDTSVGATSRSIFATFSDKWLDSDAFVFSGGTGAKETIKLTDIVDIDTDVRLYAPIVKTGGDPDTVYVHSKLALIDDTILVVGSANWTYRSMVYDGEITAFINNPTIATRARTTLFDHYNSPNGSLTPTNFVAKAAQNETDLGTFTNGRHLIVPVPAANFSRTTPTHSGNYTWY